MKIKLIKSITLLILLTVSLKIFPYETDQYSTLFYELADSTAVMDKTVNDAIEHIVNNWNKERNDYSLLSRISGFFHSRQLEKWINESPLIQSRNVKSDSIFKTTGWKNSIIIKWKGLASSFTLDNIQIGTDKMSHFFGVGWMFWKISERDNAELSEDERRKIVIDKGVFTEQTYWGRSSTNVFSNADLVANWEGYLFFRGILEDNIVNGKKAIIRWEGDRPVIQRKFTFKDHINDFWSEALLPNDYDPSLADSVKNVLMTYCQRAAYIKNPARWVSNKYEYYWKKYISLGLKKDALKYRMDTVCATYHSMSINKKNTFKEEQRRNEQEFREDISDGDFRFLDLIPFIQTTIQRIDSVVPTCNIEIQKAKNEHIMIENLYKKYDSKISKKIQGFTKNILKESDKKPDRAKAFFRYLFGKIKTNKIKEKKLNNLTLRRLTKRIKINNEKVKVIAEYSNYGKTDEKACIIVPIPFKESAHSVRQGFVKASNYQCRYINRKTGKIKASYFWRAYDKNKKLRSSLEGYYNLLDREAYMYRMIPKICKWY